MKHFLLSTLLFVTLIAASVAAASMQSVRIAGIIKCNEKSGPFLGIQAWHSDSFDSVAGTHVFISQGAFFIDGKISISSTGEPEIQIKHRCGDSTTTKCIKQITIKIPDEYIADGSDPHKTFRLNETINLNIAPYTNICS